MTMRANAEFAEQMGTAHEDGQRDSQPIRERRMDLWNNEKGRQAGYSEEVNGGTERTAKIRCREMAEAGPPILIISLRDSRVR